MRQRHEQLDTIVHVAVMVRIIQRQDSALSN